MTSRSELLQRVDFQLELDGPVRGAQKAGLYRTQHYLSSELLWQGHLQPALGQIPGACSDPPPSVCGFLIAEDPVLLYDLSQPLTHTHHFPVSLLQPAGASPALEVHAAPPEWSGAKN